MATSCGAGGSHPAVRVLRIGVIGCGGVAQMMHLPLLRKRPDCFILVALSDISPTLLRTIGALYGVEPRNQFLDYHDLVMCDDVDAVFVLNGGSHAPQVMAAVEAGKHVLVEKPLCYTLREADEVSTAARRMGVVVMVAYMKRYDPGYRIAKTVMEEIINDVRYVQVNTLHPAEDGYLAHHNILRFHDAESRVVREYGAANARLLDEAIGGGVSDSLRRVYSEVMVGSMVHDVNAVRGLLGEPDRVVSTEIWGEGSRGSVTTVLAFGDRTRAVVTWTYLEHLRDYFEEIAVMSPAHRLRIQFPSPYLCHFPTPVVVQSMEGGAMTEKRITASYEEAFGEEHLAFYACVTKGHEPLTSVADARRDIALLQQIFARFSPPGLSGEAANRGQ